MKRYIAVTGGTGFIGSRLVRHFNEKGDRVVIIGRALPRKPQPGIEYVTWDRLDTDGAQLLEGVDAIVNLAGESINQRWSRAAKERILNSRLKATEAVARLVDRLAQKPRVVVNGSGMSIYGTSEHDTYDESGPPRQTDFLAEVVEQWEQAAQAIRAPRLVLLRIGLVLGTEGGALPPMLMPYRLFAGGRVGSGRQWMSWIHLDDMVRLIDFCIERDDIRGPVNATAPAPVRNDDFGRAVGRAMGRPHWFPVPSFVLKAVFGELSVLLLEGQRVIPRKLQEHGFKFTYPTLEEALSQLLSGAAVGGRK